MLPLGVTRDPLAVATELRVVDRQQVESRHRTLPELVDRTLIAEHTVPETSSVPLWVVLAAQGAIAVGTAFGGWRIVHTMGSRITRLQPVQGLVRGALPVDAQRQMGQRIELVAVAALLGDEDVGGERADEWRHDDVVHRHRERSGCPPK